MSEVCEACKEAEDLLKGQGKISIACSGDVLKGNEYILQSKHLKKYHCTCPKEGK